MIRISPQIIFLSATQLRHMVELESMLVFSNSPGTIEPEMLELIKSRFIILAGEQQLHNDIIRLQTIQFYSKTEFQGFTELELFAGYFQLSQTDPIPRGTHSGFPSGNTAGNCKIVLSIACTLATGGCIKFTDILFHHTSGPVTRQQGGH